ncbi:hypothetical protein [Aquirufa salirivi]|uniref:Periplasmic heavy metal sensor n=1 Tax=Aquirufa salirivi TaxID=3104729 RepID=A0ABW8RVK2_9BACT
MKKLIALCAMMAMFLGLSTKATAQDFDPKAMVQRQLDRYSTELKLTDDQVKKLEPIISSRMQKMMEFRQAGMEREQMMAEMKKINDGQLESLKGIFTPEQLEKYFTLQSQMRQGGPRN